MWVPGKKNAKNGKKGPPGVGWLKFYTPKKGGEGMMEKLNPGLVELKRRMNWMSPLKPMMFPRRKMSGHKNFGFWGGETPEKN